MKPEEEIKKEFLSVYQPFIRRLQGSGLKVDARFNKPNPEAFAQYKEELPPSLADFYSVLNGLKVEWAVEGTEDPDLVGTVNIIAIEHLFGENSVSLPGRSWTINGDYAKPKQLKGFFRPVDMFVNEASVGFFSEPGSEKTLFFQEGASFFDLKISFDAYFKLLCSANAFLWWQNVIRFHEYGEGESAMERFKEQMPRIFSGYSFDDFVELYESLKIRE